MYKNGTQKEVNCERATTMCEQLFPEIHKTFGHHPKIQLFWPLLSTQCVFRWTKAMLCVGFDKFRILFEVILLLFVLIVYRKFPLYKRICVIIIVKNYSFSFHHSEYYEFHICTIFMVLIFSHNDHRQRVHKWNFPASFTCWLHKKTLRQR